MQLSCAEMHCCQGFVMAGLATTAHVTALRNISFALMLTPQNMPNEHSAKQQKHNISPRVKRERVAEICVNEVRTNSWLQQKVSPSCGLRRQVQLYGDFAAVKSVAIYLSHMLSVRGPIILKSAGVSANNQRVSSANRRTPTLPPHPKHVTSQSCSIKSL